MGWGWRLARQQIVFGWLLKVQRPNRAEVEWTVAYFPSFILWFTLGIGQQLTWLSICSEMVVARALEEESWLNGGPKWLSRWWEQKWMVVMWENQCLSCGCHLSSHMVHQHLSSFLFPLRRTQHLECFDLLLMADELNERPELV